MEQFTIPFLIRKSITKFVLTLTFILFINEKGFCKNLFSAQTADSLNPASTIILYHPAQSFGGDYYYDVSLNDSVVYATEWGTADTLNVQSEKQYNISAKTGKKSSLQILTEKGKTYFVRCGIRKALLLTQPYFELIEKDVAEKELVKIKRENINK